MLNHDRFEDFSIPHTIAGHFGSPVVVTALVPPWFEKVMVARAPRCVAVERPIVGRVHPRLLIHPHPPFHIRVLSSRRGMIIMMVLDDARRCLAFDDLLLAIFRTVEVSTNRGCCKDER